MNLTSCFVKKGLTHFIGNNAFIILRTLSTVQRPQKQEIYDMNKFYTYTKNDGYIRHSPYESIQLPNCLLHQYVWKNINKFHDKIATVCGVTGRKYTYSQLRDYSAAFAIRLQSEFNLKQNDVIAVCLPNIPEYPIATLGAIEAGLIVTPINPIYTAEEISQQLINSDAKLIIGTIEGYPILKKSLNIIKKSLKIICIKTNTQQQQYELPIGAIDFYDAIKTQNINFNNLKLYDTNPNDLVFLPYSSGTTGLPKGVMLSHKNITGNCEQIQVKLPITPLISPTTNDFQDSIPSVLPFFHIYGFTVCLTSKLSLGCKIVSYPKFQTDLFLKSLNQHQATVLHLVPPIILYLTNNINVCADDLKSVRCIMSGAAPIGQLDAERFCAKYPHIEIIQGYGLTETSPVCAMNMKGNKNYASIGGPAPNTNIKIVDINDRKNYGMESNKMGEILVRGPQCMLGYFKNEAANKTILTDDGWVRTGDIGFYDNDGYIYVTERLKELIKVKGYQVAPAELEEILRDNPKVDDAAVIGIPHDKYGEVPRAFIVLKQKFIVNNNNNNNANCEYELKKYVEEKVAHYKRLEGGIEFIDKIPRNASGKILRKQIKDEYSRNNRH